MRLSQAVRRLLATAALGLAAGCACTWTPQERQQVEQWREVVTQRGEGTWELRLHSWHT
jgi:hypothetical protein